MREQFFKLIFDCMADAGGDGWVILCCNDWKKNADEFEKWSQQNYPKFPLKREDKENRVVFSDNQEAVTIAHFNYEENPKNFTECYIRTLLI